ncbi:MAG TPA: S4 domain-containing protein [Candidatus Acidoferrales bacterium]|nr:S4 domain-containing protein [Candidatus Acidoferrales bacterium]
MSRGSDPESGAERVRLDRWLWAARFFKTRVLASAAVAGGKVHCNGAAVKPAHPVRVGDRLSIRRGYERLDVEISRLSVRRGPACAAMTLYVETPESLARRERERENRRLAPVPDPGQRPDKRARRRLLALNRMD